MHLKKYRKVYSISGAVSEDVRMRAGIRSPVVLNGINFFNISPRMDYPGEENMPVRIVQVGRMIHEIKGQHVLLKALYKLIILEKFDNIYLDLIGSGPSLSYLQSLADTLTLNEHVSFLGERSRPWIYEHLSSYHILVQPSLSEGFGLTVLEGIAAGLPVIASDHAGPCEILSDMPGGYLFRSGDEEALADAIRKVIAAMREGKMRQQCQVSREIADRRYSIRRTAAEYLHHYSLLL
jgi:glycosyltransferase involved in cell wall biosynthesis